MDPFSYKHMEIFSPFFIQVEKLDFLGLNAKIVTPQEGHLCFLCSNRGVGYCSAGPSVEISVGLRADTAWALTSCIVWLWLFW